MKICSPQLGISPTSKLGGEIYDHQTLKGFAKRGIKVFIYLPKNRNYDKNLKNFYVTYSFLKHVVPPWLYSFICLPYLFGIYKKEKFDILRIHSPRFLGIAGLIFHFFYPDVPILVSAVTVDDSRLFFPIEKELFKISSRIIVQSNYMKGRLLKRFGISSKKIVVTYGGSLDSQTKWDRAPKESKYLSAQDPVILFMGVLVKRKNPLFLIEVFSRCKDEIKNLKLVVIGPGPLANEMKRELKTRGLLKNSIFITEAYGQDKAFWLSRMNIFVFPSFEEGFGLVVTEAMSFAKPVITSDIAVFKEIITSGKNGYALTLSNINIWVKTIMMLIKNPNLSRSIGKEAKKTVEDKFSWEKTYDLNTEVVKDMNK